MKNRRLFLKHFTIATVGVATAPTAVASPINKSQSIGHKNNSHLTDLRTGNSNRYVKLQGCVFHKSGNFVQEGALLTIENHIEKPGSKNKSIPIQTNKKGEYQFLVDYPTRKKGKMPRIKFNISNDNNSYSSEVLFNDYSAFIRHDHWQINEKLGDRILPERTDLTKGIQITLNLLV